MVTLSREGVDWVGERVGELGRSVVARDSAKLGVIYNEKANKQ